MPGLKDLLKKKEKIVKDDGHQENIAPSVPRVTIMRTTTNDEETLEPPSFPDDNDALPVREQGSAEKREKKHRSLGFRKSSNATITKDPTAITEGSEGKPGSEKDLTPTRPKTDRRLSERFHLNRERSKSSTGEPSTFLPGDLPEAPVSVAAPPETPDGSAESETQVLEQREAQWEKRATLLAQTNHLASATASPPDASRTRSPSPGISAPSSDVNIQEAIRLHESGALEASTHMFGLLADPKGSNNALAQVLYGLALRHGWGIATDPEKAVHYLSLAAANSASVEEQALASGMKKGGAAKGELVLAIFELGNSFRHGWGVKKDPVAARNYYETAANLGDTDAMEEAAWCFLEGFGGAKDKFKAAQYLRLAEQKGHKSVGNSWIWKEKYNPK